MNTQTEVKHTPGPWKLLHHQSPRHDGYRAIYGPGNKVIAEMLHAIKFTLDVLAINGDVENAKTWLRRALAKAEGRI